MLVVKLSTHLHNRNTHLIETNTVLIGLVCLSVTEEKYIGWAMKISKKVEKLNRVNKLYVPVHNQI